MKLTKDSVYIYLLLEFAELIRLGYSRGLLFASWRQACTYTRLVEVGICSLSGIQANLHKLHSMSGYNNSSRNSRDGGSGGNGYNGNRSGGGSYGYDRGATAVMETVEMAATGDLRVTTALATVVAMAMAMQTMATVEAAEEAAEVAAEHTTTNVCNSRHRSPP